jgi:uncharacterized protein
MSWRRCPRAAATPEAEQDRAAEVAGYRPCPPRRVPWVGAQTLETVLFAHWQADPAPLRRIVPQELPVDTRDGRAWLAVSLLAIHRSRLRLLPPPPRPASFPQVNVRTYATVGGRPGVVFLSLDADNAALVALARVAFRLPYLRASISLRHAGGWTQFDSRRTDLRAPMVSVHARYRAAGAPSQAAAGSIEHWLTERYCAYTLGPGGLVLRVEIHHPPWTLVPADASVSIEGLGPWLGLDLARQPDLVHLATRQHVLFWPPWPARR